MSAIGGRLRDLVVKSPKDPEVRSVYADFLIQEGDPRGMFITLQTHLARSMTPDKREATRREAQALLAAHAPAWTSPTHGWAEVRFKAGFIHAIRATAADFLAHGASLVAVEPVLDVTLTKATDTEIATLATSPALAKLSALSCSGSFEAASATLLAKSAHLAALSALTLHCSELDATFAAAAANMPALSSLSVTGIELGDEGVSALAAGAIAALERLYLSRTGLSDDGVTAIAQSRTVDKLRKLCLGGNDVSDAGAAALAKARSLGSVAVLELNQTGLSDEGAAAIAKSRSLKSLRKLDVRQTEVSQVGWAELKKRPGLEVVF